MTDPAITGVSPAPTNPATLAADCSALLAAGSTLVGSAGTLNWATTTSMSTWSGITLSSDSNRVTRIALAARSPKLNGSIPDLSALTALERLNLQANELTGAIPDVSALTALERLNLAANELTGVIPDLTALTVLRLIALDDNELTGAIPDLTPFTELSDLTLGGNRLSGSIPPLPARLSVFVASGMNLTGAIPSLSGLTELTQFSAQENKLTGEIPSLTGLANLEVLTVNDNALTGPIPSLTGLASLQTLNLGNAKRHERGIGNNLDGPIPSLGALVALEELYLSDSGLTGPIPDLSSLTALNELRLDSNDLSGPLPDLSSLTTLDRLDVRSNGLTGAVPDLSALTSMDVLHLASNGFTRGMPAWLDSMTSLDELSLCFNDFTESETLPTATEARRSAGDLEVKGCLRIDAENVSGREGTDLTFNVTHSSWPLREQHGLSVVYNTVGQTASPLDYGVTSSAALTIPAMGADEFTKSAAVTVSLHVDSVDEYDETFLLKLVDAYKLENPQGTASGNTPRNARWTATGTILGAGPPPPPGTGPGPGPGPGPAPAPDPGPAPDPDPDPDPGPDPAACDRLVAPYWRGDGGIAVQPKNGRSAVFRHSCRGAQTTETLYANEAGLIVQLLSREACTDDAGKEIVADVSVEGAEDGGWYWIDGDRNAAVAPLLCEVQLGGSRATVPDGVSTDVTADATLFEHHASRLLGIVPHLQAPASGACSEYVASYWKGTGGIVVSATDGESAQLTNTCGGVSKMITLKANDAGLIVQLLGEGNSDASSCTDGAGKVLRSDMSIAGVEPGGWYWLNGARNAAVAPLACADQLGGAKATVPAGVDADATAAGTLFEHHVAKLIGIVPHLRRD